MSTSWWNYCSNLTARTPTITTTTVECSISYSGPKFVSNRDVKQFKEDFFQRWQNTKKNGSSFLVKRKGMWSWWHFPNKQRNWSSFPTKFNGMWSFFVDIFILFWYQTGFRLVPNQKGQNFFYIILQNRSQSILP